MRLTERDRLIIAEAQRRGIGLDPGDRKPSGWLEKQIAEFLTLTKWLQEVTPTWDWQVRWQQYIHGIIKGITLDNPMNLIVQIPVRHGKSELFSVRYPLYRMEREGIASAVVCYSDYLSNRFSNRARSIARSRGLLQQGRASIHEWELTNGGSYRSTGRGGGIHGTGFHLLTIDDLIKNRKEAESVTYRETIWDLFINDLWTRREPGCSTILVGSRWHEDDVAGRILADPEFSKTFKVIDLPALAEENDVLGRQPGEALFPARYTAQMLIDLKNQVGEYVFNSLYQQRPTAKEGRQFKIGKLRLEQHRPQAFKKIIRAWDVAHSEQTGDFTVGLLLGIDANKEVWILDVVMGQWAHENRDEMILETAMMDGIEVPIWLPQDPSAGKSLIASWLKLLSGYSVSYGSSVGDKEIRASPVATQVNSGNVHVYCGTWKWRDLIEQLRQFPHGAHDDIVDALAYAFNALFGVWEWE